MFADVQGRLPYEKAGSGCSSENINRIPTEDQSGYGSTLEEPLKTEFCFQWFLLGLKHEKCTPLSGGASLYRSL